MNTINKKMKIISPKLDDTFFGNALKDLEPETSKSIKSDLDLIDAPVEYLDFLERYGVGELSSFFRIDYQLLTHNEIYGREIKELEGMLIFASDIGDYLYAFDTKNNWEVVDIDTSGEVFERYGDFETFMNSMLDDIIQANKA